MELGALQQNITHRFADTSAQLRHIHLLAPLRGVVQQVQHCGFQPGKAEIQRIAVDTGMRQRIIAARRGDLIETHAAGIRQPHRPGGFIKAFAGRIVPGAADHLIVGITVDQHQMAVAARDHQRQKRRF